MTDKYKQLWKKVSKMDLGNPVVTALVGLVIFYIGLKTFSGGMKSMGNMEHLHWFTGNIIYMFIGGIVMTLLWQSSSLSTTAIIALVASGAILYCGNRMCAWSKHRNDWNDMVSRFASLRWYAER